jgi:hypothetical protein
LNITTRVIGSSCEDQTLLWDKKDWCDNVTRVNISLVNIVYIPSNSWEWFR